jgi:NAD(P)H dehydrogenase (quinone)
MILVTGAGGKTGKAVIKALVARGVPVRAFVRSSAHEAALTAMGVREVVAGAMDDVDSLSRAVRGMNAIYHICPNVNPREVVFAKALITAATNLSVSRLVYHSVLHPQIEAMPHHWNKLRVEEALFTSGLPFTILQPAPYMQNVLAGWAAIAGRGVYSVPYPVETCLSLVDLEDVADAAATVLTAPGHLGAIYELAGTLPMSQTEVAAILAEQLGRPVAAISELVDTWEKRVRAGGLGESQISTLRHMFDYYYRYGLPGNPNVLGWLLGHPPSTLAAFAAHMAQDESL